MVFVFLIDILMILMFSKRPILIQILLKEEAMETTFFKNRIIFSLTHYFR